MSVHAVTKFNILSSLSVSWKLKSSNVENYWKFVSKTKFGLSSEPTVPDICKFIAKVSKTGFILDASRNERARIVHTSKNIEVVAKSMRINVEFLKTLTSWCWKMLTHTLSHNFDVFGCTHYTSTLLSYVKWRIRLRWILQRDLGILPNNV